MADNKQVLESSTVSQEPVGKVFIVYGTAKAISSDGTTRDLAPNSAIYAQDRIITESDGRLSIVFNDSTNSQLNLGRMSDIVIDEDVYNTDTADLAEVTSEVEEIQEALLAEGFDPTTELAAPAAGDAGSASDGGGHPVVSFETTGEVVVPTSGAETTGVERSFLDPVGGITEPDIGTPSSEQLDINVNLSASSEAYEGGLITYTVTLSDAVKKSLTINLSNGASIIIPEGETTGTTTVNAPADDPYIDAGTLSVNIDSVEVGDDQTYIVDKTFAVTNITDTIDPTTLTLEATTTVEEGADGIIYTATIDNAFDAPP
ncbi:MAG: retention module-containing protein, partial [Desulfovibrionaceae bacterium]|nr:retention module-containing protein [Desulfovibrionaceae bacterium]